MKIRKRGKIQPIHLLPNDEIVLSYIEKDKASVEVLGSKINRSLSINEAVIFDVEKGDFAEAQDGIGGAFLSCEKRCR